MAENVLFVPEIAQRLGEFHPASLMLPTTHEHHLPISAKVKLLKPVFLLTDPLPQVLLDLLDPDRLCIVTLDLGALVYSIQCNVDEIAPDGGLVLRAARVGTLSQRRSFFRIDAEVSLCYWGTDEHRPKTSIFRRINLSGSGFRFESTDPFSEGQQILFELALPEDEQHPIQCKGRVVRVFNAGSKKQQVAIEMMEIEEEDRDKIISFCFSEQRRQLRMRVHIKK